MESVELILESKRLELHHVSIAQLIHLYEERDDQPLLAAELFTNPYRVLIAEQGPLRWRVPAVKADPSCNKWFVRMLVLKQSREVIGSISFHGAPEQNGMIEIGLGIQDKFQNQGFAKEALMAMWQWASAEPGVKSFRYTVSPENIASIKVIESFDFPFIGVQIDEEDGPENVYEMQLSDFKSKFLAQ
jgi:RimJ/RimL family protein N-acetyltransferase